MINFIKNHLYPILGLLGLVSFAGVIATAEYLNTKIKSLYFTHISQNCFTHSKVCEFTPLAITTLCVVSLVASYALWRINKSLRSTSPINEDALHSAKVIATQLSKVNNTHTWLFNFWMKQAKNPRECNAFDIVVESPENKQYSSKVEQLNAEIDELQRVLSYHTLNFTEGTLGKIRSYLNTNRLDYFDNLTGKELDNFHNELANDIIEKQANRLRDVKDIEADLRKV